MNNIWLTWRDVFTMSYQNLWYGFVDFAPKLIIAVLFFIIGWILGSLVCRAIEQVFASLKVDNLFKSVGADNVVRRTGMNLNTGHFIGEVVRWFIIIVFLLPSVTLLFGADNAISGFLTMVLAYLPNVIVAAFILIIAAIVSEAISKTIMASARGMNVHAASMLATIAKYAVWIFAFIIALSQLGVAEYYMGVLFTAIMAMLAIAGGLAFGLGGKEHASRFLSKLSDEAHRM